MSVRASNSRAAGKDYYRFINETWLKETEIPPDAASTNISRQIAERIEMQLIDIVRNEVVHHPDSKLSKFVDSIYHTWNNPRQTEKAVVDVLSQINAMNTGPTDIARIGVMIGRLNRLQARSPLLMKVTTDSYDTSYYRLQISEYIPCVPHNHLLLDPKYEKERAAYRSFVDKVGTGFGIPNLDGYVDLEIAIAQHLPTPIEEDDTPSRYHKVSVDSLLQDYSVVPWTSIFHGLGTTLEAQRKHEIIVSNPEYLRYFATFFGRGEKGLADLKLWLTGATLLTMGRFVSGQMYQHYFDFYGKVLKGAITPSNIHRIMLTILTTHLPQMLSEKYTRKYVPTQIRDKTIDLVKRLKRAAIRRIRAAQWMTPNTQSLAIHKVEKMGFKVAFPDAWRDESRGEDFSSTQLLKNLFTVNEKDTSYALEDIGQRERIKSEYWDSSTYEVNAFYYPDYNEMVIPAGILQTPFYDHNKSEAWNLGGIGNVITHEMTHGFDTEDAIMMLTEIMRRGGRRRKIKSTNVSRS